MMKKLLIIFCLLLLPLCCHAQQSGDATAILTGGLYTLSTGSGGGNATVITVVQIVRGNLVLMPQSSTGTLNCFTNDTFSAAIYLNTSTGQAIAPAGTLTATITRNGFTVASNIAVTVIYGNLVTLTVPSSATGIATKSLNLTITMTNNGTVQTFGPLPITVSTR